MFGIGSRGPTSAQRRHLGFSTEVVALAQLDRIEEARQALERARAIKPDLDLNFVAGTLQQMRWTGRELYIDALKKLGLEE